ncbi:unnamed protein product [Cylicostephanus goldi]|uniref:U2A'/phosphoprotein 32 family A C-terminal domain-containing protein n=1 Tax=Cylicostephanus goldi TaxID=71465 RepID=A0A3P6QG74_CYLGO|nr:unnamed protein product [Cylicostephanus goldi]
MLHLIADDNLLNEHSFDIPAFPKLKTLSLDVNRVRDVPTLLYNLRRSCPNLTSLSIIGNPGWTVVCNRSSRLNKQYRNAALDMLPLLQSLDAKTTFKQPERCELYDSDPVHTPPNKIEGMDCAFTVLVTRSYTCENHIPLR